MTFSGFPFVGTYLLDFPILVYVYGQINFCIIHHLIDLWLFSDNIEMKYISKPQKLKDFFWDMFIVDAFLGNFNRHNGNWGILVDEQRQYVQIAPVYDCGSCLYPQMDHKMMQTVLNDENEINQRIYVFPSSAILENGKKKGKDVRL